MSIEEFLTNVDKWEEGNGGGNGGGSRGKVLQFYAQNAKRVSDDRVAKRLPVGAEVAGFRHKTRGLAWNASSALSIRNDTVQYNYTKF